MRLFQVIGLLGGEKPDNLRNEVIGLLGGLNLITWCIWGGCLPGLAGCLLGRTVLACCWWLAASQQVVAFFLQNSHSMLPKCPPKNLKSPKGAEHFHAIVANKQGNVLLLCWGGLILVDKRRLSTNFWWTEPFCLYFPIVVLLTSERTLSTKFWWTEAVGLPTGAFWPPYLAQGAGCVG